MSHHPIARETEAQKMKSLVQKHTVICDKELLHNSCDLFIKTEKPPDYESGNKSTQWKEIA